MENKLYKAATQMSPVIYKDFYRIYYRERLKAFRITATIIGLVFIAAAVMLYFGELPVVWTAILAWLGLFLIVYPRVAYRRPYKRASENKRITHFTFYEDLVAEKTNGEESLYDYAGLLRVYETPRYIFIYHTEESVSIVIKDEIKPDPAGLSGLLRSKVTDYRSIR